MSRQQATGATAQQITTRLSTLTTTTTARLSRRRAASLAAVLGAAVGFMVSSSALPQSAAAEPLSPGAAAAPYPPPGCSAQLSSTVVRVGQQITVTGNCFKPGTQVTIKLDSVVLTKVSANSSGVATATVTIPPATSLGTHQISLSGLGSNGIPLVESGDITVVFGLTAATQSAHHDSFPLLPVAGSATAALLGGGGGVFLRRRLGNRR